MYCRIINNIWDSINRLLCSVKYNNSFHPAIFYGNKYNNNARLCTGLEMQMMETFWPPVTT